MDMPEKEKIKGWKSQQEQEGKTQERKKPNYTLIKRKTHWDFLLLFSIKKKSNIFALEQNEKEKLRY